MVPPKIDHFFWCFHVYLFSVNGLLLLGESPFCFATSSLLNCYSWAPASKADLKLSKFHREGRRLQCGRESFEGRVVFEEMKGSTLLIGGLTPKVGGRDSSHSQMVIMTRVVEDLITISFPRSPSCPITKSWWDFGWKGWEHQDPLRRPFKGTFARDQDLARSVRVREQERVANPSICKGWLAGQECGRQGNLTFR